VSNRSTRLRLRDQSVPASLSGGGEVTDVTEGSGTGVTDAVGRGLGDEGVELGTGVDEAVGLGVTDGVSVGSSVAVGSCVGVRVGRGVAVGDSSGSSADESPEEPRPDVGCSSSAEPAAASAVLGFGAEVAEPLDVGVTVEPGASIDAS
jgi:hypothetical protein